MRAPGPMVEDPRRFAPRTPRLGRNRVRWFLSGVLALGISLLFGSCSVLKDALVINACGQPARVLLSSGHTRPSDPRDSTVVTVPPLSERLFESVYPDIHHLGGYTEVTYGTGSAGSFFVIDRGPNPVHVVIPASLCPG